MLLAWSDELSVGNPVLDSEHKMLIDKINELHDLSSEGKGTEKLGEVIEFLAGYAKQHFTDEEKYFTSHNYPDAAAHIELHEQFILTVGKSVEKFNAEGASVTLAMEISRFLADWLLSHIKKVDKKYAEFIATQA